MRIFIILVMACSFLGAQTLVPDVNIDSKRMDSGKKRDIQDLQEAITGYIYSQSFSNSDYDYEIPFKIQIFVESVDEGSAEISYNCQAFFTNDRDQRYVETGWRFPYSKGTALYRSGIYDPIASMIDFYGFLIVANELDGIELNAGNAMFNRAQDVIELAGMSKYSSGWSSQQSMVNEISGNFRLRRARLLMNECYWAIEDGAPDAARVSLEEALKLLQQNIYLKNKDKYTRIFIEHHYKNTEWLSQAFQDTFFLPAFRDLIPENNAFFDRVAEAFK